MGYFVSEKIDNGIEAALTSFAKERLESVALAKPPTVDLIAAYILRAIYLRATSRPHSCLMDGQQYHDASDRSIRHST